MVWRQDCGLLFQTLQPLLLLTFVIYVERQKHSNQASLLTRRLQTKGLAAGCLIGISNFMSGTKILFPVLATNKHLFLGFLLLLFVCFLFTVSVDDTIIHPNTQDKTVEIILIVFLPLTFHI